MSTGTAPPGTRRRKLEDWNLGDGNRPPVPRGAPPAMDPRMWQRRVEVQQAVGRRRARILGVVAAVATVAAVAFGVLHTSVVGIRRVEVRGARPGSTDAAMLRSAGLRRGEPLVDVDPAAAARRLDALAWVSSAHVSRSWPSGVAISVRTRTAVAQVPVGSSSTGPVEEIDATGRVIARRSAPVGGLPVLLGVGTPGAVGSWLAGSSGAGRPLGSAATRPGSVRTAMADATSGVEGALAAAAGIRSLGGAGPLGPRAERVTRLEAAADGTVSAVVDPGAITVTLGAPTSLAAKVTALVSMLDAERLPAGSTLDVTVPDRPTVTPASSATGHRP